MAGTGDATVMARTGKWLLSLHDKPELLRKLQGSIHFETTLTASSVSGYLGQYSRLALPCSFVQWHGDKFGRSVILRTDSSPKAWPVTTDIRFTSPASSQVEFSGGWRAFADFNGLLEGDSLIFSLTAMSEFKVHIFRSNGSATEIPSQVQREPKPDCEVSQKTAAKQSSEYKNEQSSAEEITQGAVMSSGLLVAKKEIIAEELESEDSNSKYVTDSSSRRCDGPKCQSPTRSEVLRKLQGSIHFEKTLTASSASGYHGRDCKLALPLSFVRRHGDKFRKAATLRTESSTKAWPVSMSVHLRAPARTQVRFTGGWRAFVDLNCLMAGDFLIFSLTAISEFEVYMFPGTAGSRKEALPSQLAPREWSDGAVSPTKKAKQSYECKTEQSSAAKSSEGAVKSSGLLVAKKEIISAKLPTKDSKPKRAIGERCAVSAFGHSPSSLRISSYVKDSKSKKVTDSFSGCHIKEEEPALESDKLTEAGASGGRNNPGYDHRGPTLPKIFNRNFQLPGFYKKLGACHIRRVEAGKRRACVEIPLDFWKAYGERLHSLVKLQGVREESEVQTVVCCPAYSKQTRIYLRAGWGDFANDNNLEVGQELLFTLTADSYFVVREVLPPP